MLKDASPASETAAWRRFWTGRAPGGEHRYRDPQTGAVLRNHWRDRFADWRTREGMPDMIDLACGEGEVLRLAFEFAAESGDPAPSVYCTDISPEAIAMAATGFGGPEALGIAADCARLPLADGMMTRVVSQFGLEYAGAEAFAEAARIVRPGGSLHALVHCKDGAIERSCRGIAELLSAVRDSRLLACLAAYADTVPRAARGEASDAAAQTCVAELRTALQQVSAAIGAASPGPARDHVARLALDAQTLAQRLAAYAPADVEAWIAAQTEDIEAFHHRMTSMERVAQSADGMRDIARRAAAEGLTVNEVATLDAPHHEQPLAWILDARRPI